MNNIFLTIFEALASSKGTKRPSVKANKKNGIPPTAKPAGKPNFDAEKGTDMLRKKR